jgi:hypothetical protein
VGLAFLRLWLGGLVGELLAVVLAVLLLLAVFLLSHDLGNRRAFQEGDQVDQAERAAEDLGAVGGDGGALAGLEEDDQGAWVVVADPGVDAVALAGSDVEDDGRLPGGRPGRGAVGGVEVGDLHTAVGDRLEARPEVGIAGDEQDRLGHGPNLPLAWWPEMQSVCCQQDPAKATNPPQVPACRPGDMLRA